MLEVVGCADNADGFVGLCGGSFDAFDCTDCIDDVDACDAVLESKGLLSSWLVGLSESRREASVDEEGILLLFRGAGGGGEGRD